LQMKEFVVENAVFVKVSKDTTWVNDVATSTAVSWCVLMHVVFCATQIKAWIWCALYFLMEKFQKKVHMVFR
jgi:hypothetical protein